MQTHYVIHNCTAEHKRVSGTFDESASRYISHKSKYRVGGEKKETTHSFSTRLGQLGANISPDRSSLTPQVLIGNFLFNPFVVCHKYWEKLYELQHINLLSLYLPKEDGVSPDVEYITQQIIFSIFLQ